MFTSTLPSRQRRLLLGPRGKGKMWCWVVSDAVENTDFR